MLHKEPNALANAAGLVGYPDLLAERLGTVDGLVALTSGALPERWRRIESLPVLRQFLDDYRSQILLPREWPAIQQAYRHASHQETRELIALDQEYSLGPDWTAFAEASQRLGRQHLRRLRPLRDQRLVQRYDQAVRRGEAHGWHVLVYGVVLAIYSLPLRQGLLSYAWLTLNGFVQSVSLRGPVSAEDAAGLMLDVSAGLPAAMEVLLDSSPGRIVP